ncbi:universal stress protein UspA [Salmonella enterica subsp. enterica]|nr:universal stress protein UspA [Salmonella enterica]EBY0806088.1 universal stress protein UspA [Salmonella enterica subsp. enterica serovar Berlin]ECF3779997.1 universal stress protein UspA [Salmonella enterica subsp. enterica serovar Oslo]EDR2104879.1 universal stress protein UspA [Salmonella enterica subsp. enterica]EDW0612923.1 universal stress protein UspA [Salmonella enterica subsp. enterica serovar Ball]EGZ4376739.1 universal stress protein UspA [Salmonella enterica subsp. enterica ser
MYKTILVLIDITEPELAKRVFPHINAIASTHDSRIHILTIIPSWPYHAFLELGYYTGFVTEDILKAASDSLYNIIKNADVSGERLTTHVLMGSLRKNILEQVESLGADVIIVGSHILTSSFFCLGSRTGIASHVACPVLIVN